PSSLPSSPTRRSSDLEYPGIRFHLHSGNAQDVTDRLEKGLLDFGILIQPANIDKYDCLDLPAQDVWGVALPKTHPLAAKSCLEKDRKSTRLNSSHVSI